MEEIMKEKEDKSAKNVPLQFIYPDNVKSNFVTNMIVQNQSDYFTISFFEALIPPILGDTEDKRKEELQSVQRIQAKCVSKIFVTPQKMKDFVKVLNKNFKNYEQKEK